VIESPQVRVFVDDRSCDKNAPEINNTCLATAIRTTILIIVYFVPNLIGEVKINIQPKPS
jgi:hypothetical protein